MLPCFNAEATLRTALASLVAQTAIDWECVCVDDGSSDRTWDVLEQAASRDPRFRIERFTQNRGRGAARQYILEQIRGKYLAFLDADDWMYPGRIAHEMEWLEKDSRVAAVSVCAAATRDEQLVGVIRPRSGAALPVVEEFLEPVPPPLLFPTSMIRADLARATGFDPRFRRSQDSDFLIRALLGKHYALSAEVHYAYSTTAQTWRTALLGYRYRMQAHLRHVRAYPLRVARTLATTGAKMLVYRAAGVVGLDKKLVERRYQPADQDVERGFRVASSAVKSVKTSFFQ